MPKTTSPPQGFPVNRLCSTARKENAGVARIPQKKRPEFFNYMVI